MMQVIVGLSSLANDSQKPCRARWNEDEHSECLTVKVSGAECCVQGETEISVLVS